MEMGMDMEMQMHAHVHVVVVPINDHILHVPVQNAHVNGEVAAKWVQGTKRTMVLYRAPSDEVRRTPLVAAAPLAYSCLRHDPQRQISRRAD